MLSHKLRLFQPSRIIRSWQPRVFVFATLLFPNLIFGQIPAAQPDVFKLESGKSIEREIAGGEEHSYTVDLDPNQYARVMIEQRGVDVVARLRDAMGRIVVEIDAEPRTSGQEIIEIAAVSKCACSFTVEPRQKSAAAGKYLITVAEIRSATPKDFALDEARKANTEAIKLWRAGDYDKALPVAERALAIREKELGPDNADFGLALFTLANVYSDKAEYQKAESLYNRSLEILQNARGEDHISNSMVENNLAMMYKDMGQYPKAELLLKKGLAIREKNLDPNHLLIASTLNNLAIISKLKGDLDSAKAYYERSLHIRENALGPDHPDVATSLNNLANLYTDPAKAEPLYLRALKIREARLGPDHLDVAQTLYNLSIMYSTAGDNVRSKPLCERALAIFEKALGSEHPSVSYAINLLAVIYKNTGDLAKAEELYLRSIEIKQKTQGPYHPDLAGVWANLANLYSLKGEAEKAIDAQGHANAILEYNSGLNLLAGSEKDKLGYFSIGADILDQTITLNFKTAPNSASAAGLAAEAIIRQKGRVLDAMSDSLGAVRRRYNPKDAALLSDLSDTTTRLASLVLSGPQDASEGDFQKKIKKLEVDREALEARVSLESSGFYQQTNPVTINAVQTVVPRDSALIEFAVYRPISSKAFEFASDKQNDPAAVGRPRYVAYVITSRGPIGKTDIGDATEIDKMIDNFRQALRDPKRNDVKQLARAFDEKLMKPVRALAGSSARLLISPDGELNLMPFEALVDEKDQYLVERYAISYLSSGRDLLRMQVKRDSQSSPLIIANPAFGEPSPDLIAKVDFEGKQATRNNKRRSVTTTRSISDTFFAPLSATAQEGRSIQNFFPDARLLTGDQATKSALMQTSAPSILHLATHGFFLTDAEFPTNKVAAAPKIENPLLRSGLALAGANEHRVPKDDGILTALEASGLDLWGTKLVVLSACDTGLGEVHTGEGVYGLRRSFAIAGAESLVMSLWPVSDYVTRELMTGYYKNLKQGLGRGESLRLVQLEMLKHPATRHPFYWASFIESGNWTNLSGK